VNGWRERGYFHVAQVQVHAETAAALRVAWAMVKRWEATPGSGSCLTAWAVPRGAVKIVSNRITAW
jgi:hypothetical protein